MALHQVLATVTRIMDMSQQLGFVAVSFHISSLVWTSPILWRPHLQPPRGLDHTDDTAPATSYTSQTQSIVYCRGIGRQEQSYF
jgi:hypothetical protein